MSPCALAVPADDWLIIVGHHPADEMDVEDLFAPIQAHGFDLYLNGHVHTLTQYSVDGNPAFVTSGAGAMIKTQDQGARAPHLCGGRRRNRIPSGRPRWPRGATLLP